MTGRIENFNESRGPKIVGANEIKDGPIQTLDSKTKQEPQEIEVTTHAEVITERNKIRGRKITPGETEIRVRDQPTQPEWEKIKRGEDE